MMSRSRPRDGWGRWRLVAAVATLALILAACTGDDDGESSGGGDTGNEASGGNQGGSSAGQFCQGMNIVFFPGGTEGGGFETVVYNGARAAEAAFGPDVTYTWSDWDPQKMT